MSLRVSLVCLLFFVYAHSSEAFEQQSTLVQSPALRLYSDQVQQEQQRSVFSAGFKTLYEQEFGSIARCVEDENTSNKDLVKICSSVLRNEGNAPFALFPASPKASVVLFHGLSDSPYFVRSIAEHLYRENYIVIAPAYPGHGKKDADADMQDPNLKKRWYQHVDDIMALATQTHEHVFIGGFSTGGALATRYMLDNPDEVKGLLLFSAALQLSGAAETMSDIWGIKKLAVWLDGVYQTDGPNPYKYPKVASYSGLVLLDVIKEIRLKLEDTDISKPIFAAHSMADNITLYPGVEDLLQRIKGDHTQFKIDKEFDVCHADLVISSAQIINMKFEKSGLNPFERCKIPKANPQHRSMLSVLSFHLNKQIRELKAQDNSENNAP